MIAVLQKRCSKCGVMKNLSEYTSLPNSKWKLKVYPYCKNCCRAIQKTRKERGWCQSIESKRRKYLGTLKSHAKYPERVKARQKYNDYKRTYAYLRPTICSKCGSTENIQAHHPDYNKPLESIFLCINCHAELHRKEKECQPK